MNKGKEEIRTEHCSKYVDEDGYTNIIYQSPDTKMVIRYKGDKMSYWCNSELIYSGKYSKNLTDQAERQFYSGMKQLDDSLAQLDKEVDKLNHIDTISLFSTANQSSSSRSSSRTTSSAKSTSNSGSNRGCLLAGLGYLGVFIIITIGICVILYAMGWLGGEFVSFLRDFFGSLF